MPYCCNARLAGNHRFPSIAMEPPIRVVVAFLDMLPSLTSRALDAWLVPPEWAAMVP